MHKNVFSSEDAKEEVKQIYFYKFFDWLDTI